MPRKFQTHCQPAPNPYPTMNEIPETIPCVIASFGNSDGCSDDAKNRTPVSTPGLETGLENTFVSRVCSIIANDDTPGSYAAGCDAQLVGTSFGQVQA